MCYALEEKYWGQLKMPLLLGLGRWHKVRSYWEDAEEHIWNNQSQNTHTLSQKKPGCMLPHLIGCKIFFAYPCSLPMEGAWTSRTSFSCYGCTFRPLPEFVTSSVRCILSPSHIHEKMDSIMCETIQMPPPVYSFQRNWSLHTSLQLFYNFDT